MRWKFKGSSLVSSIFLHLILYTYQQHLFHKHPRYSSPNLLYPLLPAEIASISSRWSTTFHTTPHLFHSSLRCEIVKQWESCMGGSLLKSLYQHRSQLPKTKPAYLSHDTILISITRARLRFNRSLLNNRLSIYNRNISIYCNYCYIHFHREIVEDVSHVLLHCPHHHLPRSTLQTQLYSINMLLTLPTILGCVDHLSISLQQKILSFTSSFLSSIIALRDI